MIMKTNFLFMLTAVVFLMSGCRVRIGDGSVVIEPSKNIVKAEYPQKAFDKVENHAVGKIQLVKSDTSMVTLSAPENYIDLYEFKNKNGELDISFAKKDVTIQSANVKITVYTPQLHEVSNSGAADIHLTGLTTDGLTVRNSGVGSFLLKQVQAKMIDVSCSGVGSISIDGQADEAKYSCSGVGSIDAKDMKTLRVKAHVSGVGDIACHASEYLKGRVTGVGGLQYAGHPAKKDLHRSLTGGFTEL